MECIVEEPPSTVLSNGVKVINLTSPHFFEFEDGSILDACSDERASIFKAIPVEKISKNDIWTDISLSFKLSDSLRSIILDHSKFDADIVIVPRVILDAAKQEGLQIGKLRTIRYNNRSSKKKICIDRFCI
jgi:hypothetical protein